MSDAIFTIHDEEQVARRARVRRWKGHLLLSLFIAAALVVYELTQDPLLGAAVACAKFGWDDLLTARWLLRRDPDPRRGRACFWIYLAAGLWRISVVATGLMFLLIFVGGPPAVMNKILIYVAEAAAGFLLSALTTFAAVRYASRHGVKLWVDPAVHRARVERLWPPPYARRNLGRSLLSTALMTLVLGIVFLFGLFLSQGGGAALKALAPGLGDAVIGLAVVSLIIAVAMLILATEGHFAARTIAASPADCWPDAEFSEPPGEPAADVEPAAS